MSRSSVNPAPSPTPDPLERGRAALQEAPSLHALLEQGLQTLAEALHTTPLLYLERRGAVSTPGEAHRRFVLYAAHGVGLSDAYDTMQPSAAQLERLRHGEVLSLSTPGVGCGVGGLPESQSCDGTACMVGVGLRSSRGEGEASGHLLGWVWLYQRTPPNAALRAALSSFGTLWGAHIAQMRGVGG